MFATVTVTRAQMRGLQYLSGGTGGFQSLQRELLRCRVGETDTFAIPTETVARRIVTYVETYGGGGFQQRLRPVADQLRPLLPSLPTQAALF